MFLPLDHRLRVALTKYDLPVEVADVIDEAVRAIDATRKAAMHLPGGSCTIYHALGDT